MLTQCPCYVRQSKKERVGWGREKMSHSHLHKLILTIIKIVLYRLMSNILRLCLSNNKKHFQQPHMIFTFIITILPLSNQR